MFEPKVKDVMDKVDALREQVNDHMQIPREEALLLAQLVRIGRCRSICEVGVSYGFSTLHLAAAARENGGRVDAFDISEKKVNAASEHLRQAGLDNVTIRLGDARDLIVEVQPAEPWDFMFIDAVKDQSLDYLEAAWPKLAERALIVTDNTHSHPDLLKDFVEHLRNRPGIVSCGVAVGNGFELSLKQG